MCFCCCRSCFAASGFGSGVQQESGVLVQLGLTYFGVSIQPKVPPFFFIRLVLLLDTLFLLINEVNL